MCEDVRLHGVRHGVSVMAHPFLPHDTPAMVQRTPVEEISTKQVAFRTVMTMAIRVSLRSGRPGAFEWGKGRRGCSHPKKELVRKGGAWFKTNNMEVKK
jgi:hypothetical protein